MQDEPNLPNLETIARLIGGSSGAIQLDPYAIAREIKVVFRPLPPGYRRRPVAAFRERLRKKLVETGVQVLEWEEATLRPKDWHRKLLLGRVTKSGLNAVIDVERVPGRLRRSLTRFLEWLYARFLKKRLTLVRDHIFWGGLLDDYTMKYISDTWNTLVVSLVSLDAEFANPDTSYVRKIQLGLRSLVDYMSELVIGVGEDRFSIVNMNLSDSVFSLDEFDDFVVGSFLPKIYAPIRPIRVRKLHSGVFAPDESPALEQLVTLSRKIAGLPIFPSGNTFTELIERESHKIVVDDLLDGRTGVSYGFLCVAEEPVYSGPQVIGKADWEQLGPLEGFSPLEVRQTAGGRRYLQIAEGIYHQIPELWIASSGSGSNKSNLRLNDVVRIGLVDGHVRFQILEGESLTKKQIRPSFDTYVILAQALGAALFLPHLLQGGAMPVVHFHGYIHPDFFKEGEVFVGSGNLSMACGTLHAALLNFQGLRSLAGQKPALVCLVEPDHGVNLIAKDVDYLVDKLGEGYRQGQLMLGGRFFDDLRNAERRKRNGSE